MKNPEVTQRYGRTPWSWRYAGNSHTGVDMVASNISIYAPEDGKFTRGTISCYGNPMNYAAIDHGDGVVSYYFHIR
jgi:murein DD-endopeptidase MepM/ murein hydrolase activator NlpD